MKKWIEDLLALQTVDLRVRGLKVKLATIPIERNKLAASVEDARRALSAAKEAQKKVELQIKTAEATISKGNEDIIKLQAQSTMVKKNDEYQAMLKQVEDCKARISNIETEEIELLDKDEAAKAVVKTAEKELVERERSVKSELQEFVQLEADIRAEGGKLLASRKAFEAKVEPSVLTAYARLLGRGKGTPAAAVKDGVFCSNCMMRLTPQTLGQAKGGVFVLCDNCSHIVYMDVKENA